MSAIMKRTRAADPRHGWRVLWRVIVPGAGGYGSDMVFIETDDEAEARECWRNWRHRRWAVCLERIERQPLPAGSEKAIAQLVAAAPKNA